MQPEEARKKTLSFSMVAVRPLASYGNPEMRRLDKELL